MKPVDYPEMKEVRYCKPVFSDFFGSLKKLEFDEVSKREIVVPSHVLPFLKNLEELNVHSCKLARVIFDLDESETETKGIVFRLKKLTLRNLSNLKCVWNKHSQGIVNFSNLQEVFVYECGNLVTLFPLALAKNLGNLKTLTIQVCFNLIAIVEEKEESIHGTTEKFELPSLSKLFLCKMPQLVCFYSGQHHLKCRMLERLHVACCHKVKLFKSRIHDSPLQHPMFLIEEVVPKLKELTLSEKDIVTYGKSRPKRMTKRPSQITYLRHIVANGGVFPDPTKIQAMVQWPTPQCVKGLRDFLGLTGFYRNGTLLRMSSSYHPQMDGQTEVMNRTIEQYLRAFVHHKPSLWFKFLPWVEYHYNTSIHSGSGLSPFEVMFGKQPPSIPHYIEGSSSNDGCDIVLSSREEILSLLRSNLLKAQARMKKNVDAKRRDLNLKVGSWVYIKLQPYRQISVSGNKYHKLSNRYYGPFKVMEKIGPVAYRLELPSHSKIHDVFHCSMLKPHEGSAPSLIDQIPPKWKGLSPDDTSWENWDELKSLFDLEDKVIVEGDDVILLDDGHSPQDLLHKLNFLEISFEDYDDKKDTFPFDFLHKSLQEITEKEEEDVNGEIVFGRLALLRICSLPRLSLEELHVHNSDEVQVIFGMNDSHTETKETVFHLRKLILKDLSNLKCILNKNPQESVSFPNLQILVVDGCGSLVTLFARNLVKFKTHEMQRYDKLVEIVGKEDAIERVDTEREKHDVDERCTSARRLLQRFSGIKEIFSSKKLQVHDGIPATLNALTLFELNQLESIGFEHPWVKPFSEKLQTLAVTSCPRLEKLG
ncbi:hypothetical protein V8G54_019894 [Vigna mungo]|uniref:Integrase catalytic domain-containing protein n=1 Tax=Vigna mungo TaxID=3915 RepID=A0AAQ3NEJ5_VIGMU